MKLIASLILFVFLINLILCQVPYTNYTDLIFNFVSRFLEGMADSEKAKCAYYWKKNNETLKSIIGDILSSYQRNETFQTIAGENALKFITIKRLGLNCRFLNAYPIFKQLLSPQIIFENITDYFNNNTENIYYKLIENKNDDKWRYKIFGEIFKNVTNYFVK